MGVLRGLAWSSVSLVVVVGCGGETQRSHDEADEVEPGCLKGSQGCACRGDGTCDGSLECGPDGICSKEDVPPPPPPPAAGVRIRVFGTGACVVPQGIERGIGKPPPDSAADTGRGTPLSRGEHGVMTSCEVSGGPDFTLAATVSQSPVSFRVDGQISETGTGAGSIGLYIPEANGELTSPATMPCALTAVHTSAGYQIEPGAVWARFVCTQVTQPPAFACQAEGEFVFENCE
jgi:hypothetical protein